MPGTDEMFPLVEAGDPIRAGAWNDMAAQLVRLSNIGDTGGVIATGAGTFRRPGRRGVRQVLAFGRALVAIPAADNNLEGVAFTFVRFVEDPDTDPQTTPKTLIEEVDSEDEIVETEAVNRSTKLSADADAFIQCKWEADLEEWTLDYVDDVCEGDE